MATISPNLITAGSLYISHASGFACLPLTRRILSRKGSEATSSSVMLDRSRFSDLRDGEADDCGTVFWEDVPVRKGSSGDLVSPCTVADDLSFATSPQVTYGNKVMTCVLVTWKDRPVYMSYRGWRLWQM